MKRIFVVALMLAVVGSSLAAPALAQKKKKKKKPKAQPVATVLHMHGTHPVGEVLEYNDHPDSGMPMNATAPAAGQPKSMNYAMYGVGNTQCTGNMLFPSWEATMSGTITGTLKWYVNTLAPPSKVVARIWVDIPFSSCTSTVAMVDDFKPPIVEKEVDVPPGANEVEIAFEGLNIPVTGNIIAMLHQQTPPNHGRVLYDSAEYDTRIEFQCVPPPGATACTS